MRRAALATSAPCCSHRCCASWCPTKLLPKPVVILAKQCCPLRNPLISVLLFEKTVATAASTLISQAAANELLLLHELCRKLHLSFGILKALYFFYCLFNGKLQTDSIGDILSHHNVNGWLNGSEWIMTLASMLHRQPGICSGCQDFIVARSIIGPFWVCNQYTAFQSEHTSCTRNIERLVYKHALLDTLIS